MPDSYGISIKKLAKALFDYLLYLLVRLAEEALCLIPNHLTALAVGRFFGRLMFIIVSDRRESAIENLTIAFGKERTSKEIRILARKNFEHLGMMGVEFVRLKRWSQNELAQRLEIKGSNSYNLAWSPGRNSILIVTAHYGSFEVLAALARFVGFKLKLIATPLPNRFMNRRLILSRGGAASGLEYVGHRGIVQTIIEELRNGGQAGALCDQRGDDTRPVWVDYFGTKALANGVFARFAIEGNAYCLPLKGIRKDDGTYYCEFGDEIPIEVTGDMEYDIQVNSQRFHEVFERWLREHPEQGFWMHRKFKRKPKKRRKRVSAPPANPH